MTKKKGYGKGVVTSKEDKRLMRRLYLNQEDYQTLFNAAWHKREFSPEILNSNQLIAEYCIENAKRDLVKETEEKS